MALKASPRQHLRQLQLQLLNVVDPSRITAIVEPIFSANLHVPFFFRRIPCLVLHTSRFQCWIPSLDLRPGSNKSILRLDLDGPVKAGTFVHRAYHGSDRGCQHQSRERAVGGRDPWSINASSRSNSHQQPLNPSINSSSVKAEVDGGGSVTPPWVDGNVNVNHWFIDPSMPREVSEISMRTWSQQLFHGRSWKWVVESEMCSDKFPHVFVGIHSGPIFLAGF